MVPGLEEGVDYILVGRLDGNLVDGVGVVALLDGRGGCACAVEGEDLMGDLLSISFGGLCEGMMGYCS